MKNKKILTLSLTALSTFTLAVVGAAVNNTNVQAATKNASKANKKSMNVNQIKNGNYNSIKGNWKELGHIENHSADTNGNTLQLGGDDTLTVSKNKISDNDISMQSNILTDNSGSHELNFKSDNGALVATLKDEMTPINWSVSFYPKGTTTNYSSNGKTNDTDFIVVWSSNNNHTEVFVPNEKQKKVKPSNKKATKKSFKSNVKKQDKKLNLAQIQDDNFSSLQGTWKNPTDGKDLMITDKIANAPENSNIAFKKGAVISNGNDSNGTEVICPGNLSNGYMQGGIGTYSKEEVPSSFAPIMIVPKGVKATGSDDSNSNKDRLIVGGGQNGFSTQAYYRE